MNKCTMPHVTTRIELNWWHVHIRTQFVKRQQIIGRSLIAEEAKQQPVNEYENLSWKLCRFFIKTWLEQHRRCIANWQTTATQQKLSVNYIICAKWSSTRLVALLGFSAVINRRESKRTTTRLLLFLFSADNTFADHDKTLKHHAGVNTPNL